MIRVGEAYFPSVPDGFEPTREFVRFLAHDLPGVADRMIPALEAFRHDFLEVLHAVEIDVVETVDAFVHVARH